MNILLVFPSFIIAFVIVLYYERKIRNIYAKPKNKVHFYVARDKNGALWLYIGKPIREGVIFISCLEIGGRTIGHDVVFKLYGLNKNDYKDLKWEDEPVEVFVNMED